MLFPRTHSKRNLLHAVNEKLHDANVSRGEQQQQQQQQNINISLALHTGE